MAELIFTLLSLGALFALAMNRAPLKIWALAVAIFTLSLQLGLGKGELHWPVFTIWSLLGWLIAAGLLTLTFPRIKRDYVTLPAYRALKRMMPSISETEREALEAGTTGWDAELFAGTPGLGQAPPRQPDHPHRGRARLSRRPDRGALPQAQ